MNKNKINLDNKIRLHAIILDKQNLIYMTILKLDKQNKNNKSRIYSTCHFD